MAANVPLFMRDRLKVTRAVVDARIGWSIGAAGLTQIGLRSPRAQEYSPPETFVYARLLFSSVLLL